jgi:hypothetical protein
MLIPLKKELHQRWESVDVPSSLIFPVRHTLFFSIPLSSSTKQDSIINKNATSMFEYILTRNLKTL